MTNRNKRLLWQIPFLILLITGTILIIRQQHNMPYQKCAGTIFGTTYHITYQYDDDLQKELEAKMKEVDNALSMFNKESIISRVNDNQQVELNRMFLEVFQQAQKISEDTNGAFDITVGPLVNAWGFGFKNEQMPDKHAVDSLMAIVGYQKVRCDGKRIIKNDPRITLDCSAIAKGYGVDVGNELQTVLNLTDKAMATSGNYRNFYYKGKRKYAHTIDPKTGYPVQHSILSATVLTNHCMRADAYATAFMVMGFEGAKKVLERNPDLMAYIIYDDKGKMGVWYSPSLKDKIAK